MSNEPNQDFDQFDSFIGKLLDKLDALPAPVRSMIAKELDQLLALLRDRRTPRVMFMGRRGSGKSTLLNALFGAPIREPGHVRAQTGAAEWVTYSSGGRTIDILDTRGIQEGSAPVEADSAPTAAESLLNAVRQRSPDLLLFLVKAKEVDAAIAGDLAVLEQVHKEIVRTHKWAPKILPVLTQCDELDPHDIIRLPTDDPEKQRNIDDATDLLTEHLRGQAYLWGQLANAPIPTTSIVYFNPDGSIIPRRDYRWNIDHLALKMQTVLPDSTQLNFVRLAQFRSVQRSLAEKIVHVTSGICATIGAQPIPFADLPVLTSLQLTMILTIAYISGREVSLESAREFAVAMGANVGSAFMFRELARGLIRAMPVVGSGISAGISLAGTESIGKAAILYYIDQQALDEVKRSFQDRFKQLLKRQEQTGQA